MSRHVRFKLMQPGHEPAAELARATERLAAAVTRPTTFELVWPPGPQYRKVFTGELDVLELWSHEVELGHPCYEGPDLNHQPLDWRAQFELWDAVRAYDERRFLEDGLCLIAQMYYPEFYLYSRTPIRSLDDLVGKRLRGHTFPEFHFIHSIPGAVFCPFTNTDTGTAIKTGEIDAFASTFYSYTKHRWYEHAPSVIGPFLCASRSAVLVPTAVLEEYGADDQARWRRAFADAEVAIRAGFEETYYRRPLAILRAANIEPRPVPADVVAHAREVFATRVVPAWRARTAGDLQARAAYDPVLARLDGYARGLTASPPTART